MTPEEVRQHAVKKALDIYDLALDHIGATDYLLKALYGVNSYYFNDSFAEVQVTDLLPGDCQRFLWDRLGLAGVRIILSCSQDSIRYASWGYREFDDRSLFDCDNTFKDTYNTNRSNIPCCDKWYRYVGSSDK